MNETAITEPHNCGFIVFRTGTFTDEPVNEFFVEFKGALTEQYVCQQLKTIEDLGIYYYTNDRGSLRLTLLLIQVSKLFRLKWRQKLTLEQRAWKHIMRSFHLIYLFVLRWQISKRSFPSSKVRWRSPVMHPSKELENISGEVFTWYICSYFDGRFQKGRLAYKFAALCNWEDW